MKVEKRNKSMLDMLRQCTICPRNCKVNRMIGDKGFCNIGRDIKISKAYIHLWEEPCISGQKGSGTVFFSGCNLNCVFCQNYQISQNDIGKNVTIEEFAQILLYLQDKGAHNINLVSPTPYVPMIIKGLSLSKSKGLEIPIVYNTNSYENVETIKCLKGYIDIYLPDFKYFDDKYALRYSNAPNYFKYASKAIKEMVSQVGKPVFDKRGMLKKGVIIRHLMLPGLYFDSKKIIDYIYDNFGDSVYISIMSQYTPMYKAKEYKKINRELNKQYYDRFINYCCNLGIKNAFIQEQGSSSQAFVPDFNSFY